VAIIYSKDSFKLQIQFAQILSDKGMYSYEHSLFANTTLFVRFFGYYDEKPPQESDARWQEVMKNKPSGEDEELDFFYKKYLDFVQISSLEPHQTGFGCFNYSYHQDTRQFELHFRTNDPQGNLNRERQALRMSELKTMFEDIKKKNINTEMFVITWLLNIPAFYRLFPPEFSQNATLWNVGTAQTFTFWGQFVDKMGHLKQDAARQLIENAKRFNYEDVNLYFPLPGKRSELSLKKFYDFYSIK